MFLRDLRVAPRRTVGVVATGMDGGEGTDGAGGDQCVGPMATTAGVHEREGGTIGDTREAHREAHEGRRGG